MHAILMQDTAYRI